MIFPVRGIQIIWARRHGCFQTANIVTGLLIVWRNFAFRWKCCTNFFDGRFEIIMASYHNFRRVCKILFGGTFANPIWPPSLNNIIKMAITQLIFVLEM